MGSGTTAIACIKEKRHFIGFELNKEYYDKAVKRIKDEQAQLTLF
jgi:site-specific DNA-methyltransferase (adenine-specific)